MDSPRIVFGLTIPREVTPECPKQKPSICVCQRSLKGDWWKRLPKKSGPLQTTWKPRLQRFGSNGRTWTQRLEAGHTEQDKLPCCRMRTFQPAARSRALCYSPPTVRGSAGVQVQEGGPKFIQRLVANKVRVQRLLTWGGKTLPTGLRCPESACPSDEHRSPGDSSGSGVRGSAIWSEQVPR